jgi:hypothetical protein
VKNFLRRRTSFGSLVRNISAVEHCFGTENCTSSVGRSVCKPHGKLDRRQSNDTLVQARSLNKETAATAKTFAKHDFKNSAPQSFHFVR